MKITKWFKPFWLIPAVPVLLIVVIICGTAFYIHQSDTPKPSASYTVEFVSTNHVAPEQPSTTVPPGNASR